jgi:enamine deaminase RidA (YjgF/YER057c/UK114 family)
MKTCGALLLACVLAVTAWPWNQRNEKEERTQTLELPKELPPALPADTNRLVFRVSELTSQGLLSQQVRRSLRSLQRKAGGTIVRLRAFVAGTGDVRRVRDLVSEIFSERRQPLPVLTVVHAGGLPLPGAQVIFESTAVARKEVNPHGLAFISGQAATSPGPLDPVEPLAAQSFEKLRAAVAAAGVTSRDVLRVTCFFSSLEDLSRIRVRFDREYPQAARNYLQAQRVPAHALAECEAVARLSSPPAAPLEIRNPGGEGSPYSQIALVGAPQLVFTGMQSSYGFRDEDARLAFERLEKTAEQAGVSLKDAAFAAFYPLSASIAQQVRRVRAPFFDPQRPPAATMLAFESLPAMDAGFAVDLIAVKQ